MPKHLNPTRKLHTQITLETKPRTLAYIRGLEAKLAETLKENRELKAETDRLKQAIKNLNGTHVADILNALIFDATSAKNTTNKIYEQLIREARQIAGCQEKDTLTIWKPQEQK